MSESIGQRTNSMAIAPDASAMRRVLEAQLVDITALRATVATLVTDNAALAAAVDTLAAKLNADDGVTDADYSVVNVAAITAASPSALTLTA